MNNLCLVLLSLLGPLTINAAGQSCQDIDYNACMSFAQQNANMCSDPVLSTTACPAYCQKCPVTCYNCNTTGTDVTKCNTITCQNGEMCMRVTTKLGNNTNAYKMLCGPTSVCSGIGKRHGRRDLTIDCCSHDLCNAPTTTTATKPSPTTAIKAVTTSSTVSNIATTTPAAPVISPTAPTTNAIRSCPRDIVFMVDDSVGMRVAIPAIKDCIMGVIDRLDIGYVTTRVALGTFNKIATTRWDLNRYTDKASLQNAVRNFVPSYNFILTPRTVPALKHVINYFKPGNRPNVSDVVIMVSGGGLFLNKRFLGNYRDDSASIYQLHRTTANVIAIAVGNADQSQMRRIATDTSHYFYIPSFQAFDKQALIRDVINLICKN